MARKQSLTQGARRESETSATPKNKGGGGPGGKTAPPPQADTTWYPALLGAMRAGAATRLACRSAGVSRTTLHRRLHDDPEFAAEFEDARLDSNDILIEEIRRRALEKSDVLLIFEAKARMPEIYGDRQQVRLPVRLADVNWDLVPHDVLQRAVEQALTRDDIRDLARNAKESRMAVAAAELIH